MCVYDCEYYEVSSSQSVRARKEHACIECRRTIKPGEIYERHKGLLDGRWDLNTTCPHCVAARRFLDTICSGEWVFRDVWDETERHVDGLDDLTLSPTWTDDLIYDGLDIEYAEIEGDRRAQLAGAWTHEGAAVARLVRSARRRWDGVTVDQAAELAATAIEAWRQVEDHAA
jgi:glutaredoxin